MFAYLDLLKPKKAVLNPKKRFNCFWRRRRILFDFLSVALCEAHEVCWCQTLRGSGLRHSSSIREHK